MLKNEKYILILIRIRMKYGTKCAVLSVKLSFLAV
ncbi:hypothetical protein NJNGDCLN_03078 [Mannheimia haemolytica]